MATITITEPLSASDGAAGESFAAVGGYSVDVIPPPPGPLWVQCRIVFPDYPTSNQIQTDEDLDGGWEVTFPDFAQPINEADLVAMLFKGGTLLAVTTRHIRFT